MTFRTSQLVRVKATGQTGAITTIAKHESWLASIVFVRINGSTAGFSEGELEFVREPNPTTYAGAAGSDSSMRPQPMERGPS